jgi:hypothetical protein
MTTGGGRKTGVARCTTTDGAGQGAETGTYTTGGGGQGRGAGATTTSGGGSGIPMEISIDKPAWAGVATVAPIPIRPSAITCFVFIVSRVFGFILGKLDADAEGWASECCSALKWLFVSHFGRSLRSVNKTVEVSSGAQVRHFPTEDEARRNPQSAGGSEELNDGRGGRRCEGH